MKIFQWAILPFIILIFSLQLNAQHLKENEVVVMKGEKFVLHQVRTGETIYSITKQFKVDSLILVQYNPAISQGLRIGNVLKIPYRKNLNLHDEPIYKKGDPIRFEFYTIKSRKETLYSIAQKYGISVEEIYAYNPETRKFKKGTKVRIPFWDENKEELPERSSTEKPNKNDLLVHEVLKGETLFSLSKMFNIAESEILFYNPDAKKLRAGSKIYLPRQQVVETTQTQPVIEIEKPKAETYFEHIIESGETLWGITRQYKVSESELKALNPVLEMGFPAGVKIKIPVTEVEKTQAQPVNNEAFLKHYVEKGETLFGLAGKYGISVQKIKTCNPILENRNLVFGETILIPRLPKEEVVQFIGNTKADSIRFSEAFYEVEVPLVIPESCKPVFNQFSNGRCNVALFLPLFVEANDTLNKQKRPELFQFPDSLEQVAEIRDTAVIGEKPEPVDFFKGFYKNSEIFLQFYEGVLLAVDSLNRAGMDINLKVIDTQNSAAAIREFVYSEKMLEMDLIIGPINNRVQNEVAQIAAKNRIPMISPLASSSGIVGSNSNYYQVNASRDFLIEKTAEMVAEGYSNSNFIVCKTSNSEGIPEERLVNMIREKIYNSGALNQSNGVSYRVYDFKREGPFGLRGILSKEKENVIVIPSTVEGELSVAISNINNLADDYSITLIGNSKYQQDYKSIAVDQFHNLKLRFVAPVWMDYNEPATIDFVKKFKTNFYTEPSKFGTQGYDVALYFLSALKNFGKDFYDCLPYNQVHLIQGNYDFVKVSEFGGYVNRGVSVVSYERDYDVVRKRVKRQASVVADK